MKVPSPRKTASGCTHHASRRIVSPKDRRLRTSKAMLEHPPFVVAGIEAEDGGGVKRGVNEGPKGLQGLQGRQGQEGYRPSSLQSLQSFGSLSGFSAVWPGFTLKIP